VVRLCELQNCIPFYFSLLCDYCVLLSIGSLLGEERLGSFAAPNGVEGHSWLAEIAHRQAEAAALLRRPEEEQRRRGYFHTLREILQQPATWLATGCHLASISDELLPIVDGAATLVLTGSGSSEYAGDCVRLPLQNRLRIPAQTIGGGVLLTHGGRAIAPPRPGLMVSLARSGDSPESVEAISIVVETEPDFRHLVITCNTQGRLATTYRDDPRVKVVLLADRTNDRSLVMTSSFTNMVLASSFLGSLSTPGQYIALVRELAQKADELLTTHFDTLAAVARRDFHRAVFLASGSRLGAARESALKMVEMTAGNVTAMSETYLGLRHGLMSAVHANTLIVCFLSSQPLVRAYECDLVRELNEKELGMAKVIFGEGIPRDLAQTGDVTIDLSGLAALGDDNMPVLDVILGQLLGLFRSMKEGLQPDTPSTDGIINRVVQEFKLHRAAE
jgi:tagatose-6-phosphate ketose/aldose isomerase